MDEEEKVEIEAEETASTDETVAVPQETESVA